MKKLLILLCFSTLVLGTLAGIQSTQRNSSENNVVIAKMKYQGGGDWYANRTALPNLIEFCNKHLSTSIAANEDIVEPDAVEIFNYPYIYLTGHGTIVFNEDEAENLRLYLQAGGFLHIDDNYGMDQFIRIQMKKVFPNNDFVELPYSHPIYNQKYKFKNGLPKIHEHDGKPAQGFGIIEDGRLVCFYSYESDLGNGWEDKEIYNDSDKKRALALQMGANIIQYCFSN